MMRTVTPVSLICVVLAGCQQSDPQASNKVEVGVAAYRTPDAPKASPAKERRKFWVYDRIVQGMSRAEVMKMAEDKKYKVTYPFGGDTPTLGISGTEYTLGFCGDQLTFASWLIDTVQL